ncbi:TetR/AcrR family transcriptional regulator [Cupriavidus basilensis]|uniref:TetR/AcrR family transcriptional regulator n=1 Tax=Cupriavidus basilensis TaxID=68895 RepID=A0ABT6B129_9BURK|nr:TetR/AcrR family transcriptional regulator [Cupriavidus basilensis]MDF3838594.1 TetR/AcrR family transcriptional regulator [Cupriavidus basilensis]
MSTIENTAQAAPVRRRGRPPKLEAGAILTAATALLEQAGEDFSMRGLAQTMGVDPMAVYRYFPTKSALLDAVVAHAFEALDSATLPFAAGDDTQSKLIAVCSMYLKLACPVPALVRLMARGAVGPAHVGRRFDALFELAVADLGLSDAQYLLARDVVVDYLHGYALSGRSPDRGEWAAGIRLIHAGIAAGVSGLA